MPQFPFAISAQPNDETCGPTCLHAVYQHFHDDISLDQVILETGRLHDGGTLGVFLGSHALQRGYRARIYSYNLQVFDPTWFQSSEVSIEERLLAQLQVKDIPRLKTASEAYIEYLRLGGELRMEALNADLLKHYLKRKFPILTGLSATFLYGESRERVLQPPVNGKSSLPDDIGGFPAGHFVVLCGYDSQRRTVLVADPLDQNPIARDRLYAVDIDRVFSAIMLGIVTYDANLLIIRPPKKESSRPIPPTSETECFKMRDSECPH